MICSCLNPTNFKKIPRKNSADILLVESYQRAALVKELAPTHDKAVTLSKFVREKALKIFFGLTS
ncbi:hypothetical protein SCA6_003974 [Theobroma cacao]